MEVWIALAATLAFLGTAYQCFTNLWAQLDAMKFFKAHSDLLREDLEDAKKEIPWWRPLARRRRKKSGLGIAFSALTADEQSQARDYDRSALGWAPLLVATLILAITSWISAGSGSQ